MFARSVLLTGALALPACDLPAEEGWTPQQWALIESLSLPVDAAVTHSAGHAGLPAQAAALGKDLFFDARFSRSGRVRCASCHEPTAAFSDGRARSFGEAEVLRNAPTLLGAAQLSFFGWDGRKDSLWAQSLAPLEAEREHGLTRLEVARLVLEVYGERYRALFPEALPELSSPRVPSAARPVPEDPRHPHHVNWMQMSEQERAQVTRIFVRVGKLIAAYVRELLPERAAFDAYVAEVRAGDANGGGFLSARAQRGLRAFIGEARCVTCHNGPLLSDREFHNLGLPAVIGTPDSEDARAEGARRVKADEFRCGTEHSDEDASQCDELRFLDPGFPSFVGAYKTPTLRNVARTAPYMHDGQFATLEGVIEFYRVLPGSSRRGLRDPLLSRLSREVRTDELVEFLRTLSGPAATGP